jgi:flagellar motor switch protein FliN/FliY
MNDEHTLNYEEQDSLEETQRRIDRILAIKVPVAVILAQKQIRLADVLALKPGVVVEFEKSINELLDLAVANRRVGAGEAVKVGERFGLHIREIGSPADKINALKGK